MDLRGGGCRRQALLVLAASAALLAVIGGPAPAHAAAECGSITSAPAWIDYGDGLTTDVRDVLARPGVVVSSGGTAVSTYFRNHGAATTYFELHFPDLVGQPSAPEDPASIAGAADKLAAAAAKATACSSPWIALNELFASNAPAPWSASNSVYRANVLGLIQRLSTDGAYPVLLVHGDYTIAGATADWWRQVARSGAIVYEAYYDASHISALGTVIGNRRMRQGIRQFVSDFGGIGIGPDRLGVMLGFHGGATPGSGGRQGLEPREAWFQVVKWEVLAAAQVARETRLASIWSWGWANFSGADPDKPAAACVYLWARDKSLCDGPKAAGAFDSSLTEGQVVVPDGVACTFAGGGVKTADVAALTALTHDSHGALTAVFARAALQHAAPVALPQVLAVEQQVVRRAFHGIRRGYLEALTRAHATLAVARAIIRDELRRRAIAAELASSGSTQTTLEWTADKEAQAVDTAICLHDELPGNGGFPRTDARELGVVPLLKRLPFLFADRTAPASPAAGTAFPGPHTVVLAWQPGAEPDLAGYRVYRSATSGGPYVPVGPALDRPGFIDSAAPPAQPSYYVVRAFDTSGNQGAPSAEISAAPG